MTKHSITTQEQVREFWKHKIHPVTGYKAITQRDTRWGVKQRKKKDDPIR